ncbi:MAG TPA: DUF2285 domain-containing protein [Rhodopila sp.]|nr:DUF2285 domain-containing protein [Rhodopila sp.]
MMKADFFVAELAACPDDITLYDQQHFLTYARLIDAELDGADWREMARHILLLDPDLEPERARRCAESHLERAKWIETTGLRKIVEQMEAAGS